MSGRVISIAALDMKSKFSQTSLGSVSGTASSSETDPPVFLYGSAVAMSAVLVRDSLCGDCNDGTGAGLRTLLGWSVSLLSSHIRCPTDFNSDFLGVGESK